MMSIHAARVLLLLVIVDVFCAGPAAALSPQEGTSPEQSRTVETLGGTSERTIAVARIGDSAAMEKYLEPGVTYVDFMKPDAGSRLIETERWHRPTELRCTGQSIVVRFYARDGKGVQSASVAGVRTIVVLIDSHQLTAEVDVTPLSDAVMVDLESFKHSREPIKALCESGYRALVDLVVQAEEKDGRRTVVGELHLQNAHHVRNYGMDAFGYGRFGLWIPVGIFATNGKRTDDGIEFVAMPIGLAVGTQWWTSERFFLGFSLIGMYSVASTGTGASSEDKVSLTTVGAGVLLDLGSWVYLTGTHHWQFAGTAGEDDPGFMIGIGPGASLINFLAGNPQPN